MEHTMEQKHGSITKQNFEDETQRWCKEEVLKLTRHFHCYNEQKVRHNRVIHFELQDIKGFNDIRKQIESIKIYLALKKNDSDKITSCFYLRVNDSNDDNMIFELCPVTKEPIVITDAKVPRIFKDIVNENWREIEVHLVDDLFHCLKYDPQTKQNSIVRVEYFEFDDIAKDISDFDDDITAVTLYPGIDMNKFGKKDRISFTPVLGVKPRLENGQKRMGFLEFDGDETFAEYSTPCPPTCPDDPDN